MVIWLIGLSGAGKTTLSSLVYEALKPRLPNLVRLDGDVVRDLFGNDADHTVAGRRRNAERLSMLSRFLAQQDIHVVAAVLSIFPEWRRWNRENLPEYAEVYVKVSMETLQRRDPKGLYAGARRGEIPNVVGVDIPFPEPEAPDLVIENDADRRDMREMVERILGLPAVERCLR
ncbi:MAG: adenylyl-sulfate kinase [Rhodospirillaceae bacterium]